jgi:hypothetical protein
MKKTIYSIILIITSMNILSAQETTLESTESLKSTLDITGSIDAYYRTNLNADFDVAPATSFANLPGFALGMANVVIAQEGKNFGFTADLVFGPRGEDATFLSPILRPGGSSNIVNQLYAYWNVTESVKLTIGNFNTFLGYEVISPTGNFNYSTSYMFSYGPFSHTGLKLDADLGNGFSLMAGVFNPTDATEYNPTDEYAGGLQLGYESGGLGVWVNGLVADGFTQFDITAGYECSESLYLGFNATTASDNFLGLAGYVQYATSDVFKIGLRVENFTDKGIGLFSLEGVDESVLNVTLSGNYTIGNLTVIPEVRLDAFSTDIVPNDGEFNSSLSSLLLAVVYSF